MRSASSRDFGSRRSIGAPGASFVGSTPMRLPIGADARVERRARRAPASDLPAASRASTCAISVKRDLSGAIALPRLAQLLVQDRDIAFLQV